MKKIRILIADDHGIVRKGLRLQLEQSTDFEVVGEATEGREAVRTLERYLEEEQEDRDAYLYAVQWIYTVHAGGAVVHNRAEDVKRAREYADAYASARGPQLALVRQWVDYLEKGSR